MSFNSFKETMLCRYEYPGGPFFIARDLAGNCVLRVGTEDGKELFSDELDNGTKNKKHERVRNAILLMQKIDELSAAADT